jgi:amidase
VRDTPGPMARTVTDMAILLDVIVGADAEDAATSWAAGHIAPSYVSALRTDALKGARLGVLRQKFAPDVTDPRIIAHFETTLAELKGAGAEIVDPFVVPEIDSISGVGTQTPARFKEDLTRWIVKHPGVPFPSNMWDYVVGAKPVEEDPATIQGARDEQRYRDAFTKAMDISRIDAVIFPSWTQLPQINGGVHLAPPACCLTFVGSSLQWPELSVPSGYLGEGLPQGLEMLGRAWDEGKIMGYAYAYEQATHYRRPPPTVPPLAESLANRFIGTCVPKQIWCFLRGQYCRGSAVGRYFWGMVGTRLCTLPITSCWAC